MKQKIREQVDFDFSNWGDYSEVVSLINDLEKLKNLGATHIDIDAYDDTLEVDAYYLRDETDEEFNARISQQERIANISEQIERREYERLKAKFG